MGVRFLCASAALVLACTSLQGLSGGGADGGTEAPNDRDAGVSSDAALDVVTEARPPSGWCGAHPHAFCNDFDEPPFPDSWEMPAGDGGKLEMTDAIASSPPNSVAIAMSPSTGTPTTTFLRAVLTGGAKSVVCSMAIYFESLLSTPAEIMNVGVESTLPEKTNYNVSIRVESSKAYLIEFWRGLDGGSVGTTSALPLPVAGVWTDISLTVGQSSMGAQGIVVTFNGTQVLSTPGSAPPNTGQIVGVGVTSDDDPSEPWAPYVDNFTCDVTP